MLASPDDPYSSMDAAAGEWAAPAIERVRGHRRAGNVPDRPDRASGADGLHGTAVEGREHSAEHGHLGAGQADKARASEFTAQHSKIIEYLRPRPPLLRIVRIVKVGATTASRPRTSSSSGAEDQRGLQKSMDDIRAENDGIPRQHPSPPDEGLPQYPEEDAMPASCCNGSKAKSAAVNGSLPETPHPPRSD